MNAFLLLALSWVLHGWSGYQPASTFIETTQDGRTILALTNVQGKSGGCIMTTPRSPCRAGDTVRARFLSRGKGKAYATIARYSKAGGFNQTGSKSTFDLTHEWTEQMCEFRVGDGTNGETGSCDLELVVEKGGEAEFTDVEMTIERRAIEDFEGTGPFLGAAETVRGNIAPGLLSVTTMGLYRSHEPRRIEFAETPFRLPLGGPNPFLESSVRLYSFGRTTRKSATLDMKFAGVGDGAFALRIAHDAARETLACHLVDQLQGKSKVCAHLEVPYATLPADFVLSAATHGEVRLEVKSLADSSRQVTKGESKFFRERITPISTHLLYTPRDGEGELVIDNYSVGRADPAAALAPVPYMLEKAPTFDPIKEGWPLVFAEEFDGRAVDYNKWELSENSRSDFAFVRDGLLHIRCDWNDKHDKLETASLWTKERWEYGYFESRLRFTRNSGWWAAFWLCTHSCANPFKDGFEIDIFEDYYTRCEKPDGEHKPILDHNLHMFGSSILKSWNYCSNLTRGLDEFYVLGCKWTPFEISYYLDGKLIASTANHSEHKSVTFDAVSHGNGFSPLSAIVSGQIMGDSWFCHDKTGFTFPEDYLVDYVRVYAYPDKDKGARVSLSCDRTELFAKPGERQKLTVKTKPAKDGAKVKAVYLFDSGYLLDYKTEPPYTFTVDFSNAYYGSTRYMRPGRSGKTTPLHATGLHIFAAYALDEKGRYSHAPEVIERLICDYEKTRPFEGVAQTIPGVIKCGRYDEGGPGVAYSDTTPENVASKTYRVNEGVDAAGETCIGSVNGGEWLTYSVDIAKEGDYRAAFNYGTPVPGAAKLHAYIDGKKVGVFDCPAHAAKHWGADTKSVIERMHLPAGRHRLTIVCEEGFNFATLEFTAAQK